MFPDKPLSRNFKTKEIEVIRRIHEHYASNQYSWTSNRRVLDGCSKRLPDLMLDLGSHVLFIEIDEHQHADYDCSCEQKRTSELLEDIGHRPCVFIRFNPDAYIRVEDGVKIPSCWRVSSKTKALAVAPKHQAAWEQRIQSLFQQIDYWIQYLPTDKLLEIVHLFYS